MYVERRTRKAEECTVWLNKNINLQTDVFSYSWREMSSLYFRIKNIILAIAVIATITSPKIFIIIECFPEIRTLKLLKCSIFTTS